MEQAIINVEGTSTIETAAAAKKLIEAFGSQNIRALSVKRVDENSNEVVVELDFVPGLAGQWLNCGLRRHRSLEPVRSSAGSWRR